MTLNKMNKLMTLGWKFLKKAPDKKELNIKLKLKTLTKVV